MVTSFLQVVEGKLVLWNCEQHSQYEIDIPHLQRIIEIANGADLTDSHVDKNLRATGLFDSSTSNWKWDCLSRIFHIGTQIGLEKDAELLTIGGEAAYEGYINYCQSIADKVPNLLFERPGRIVDLPAPELRLVEQMSLAQALHQRQTCRTFDARPLSVQEVATTLWLVFGTVHGESRKDLESLGMTPVGYRRTSPSGGSLHPSEAYLIAMRIDGIPAGIYHYRSHSHVLSFVCEFDTALLGPLLCSQNFANDLSYGIFVTSRFDKMWWKYPHSRAYRVALLDIGCLTQTFQLVCTAQNIQSWPTGYFIDKEINKILGVDVDVESAMFFLGAGVGNGPVARDVLSLLQRQSRDSTR